MESALDIDVLRFRMQSREIFQNTLIFLDPLSQLHNYNNGNGFLPRLPKPQTEWGKRTTYFRDFNDLSSLPIELNKPMPDMIFKRNLNRFLGDSS